ncbi:unnamed protein product, partial [Mesorhabditis belari]|uniref:Uncharacterized protein n=1 Tax=Mesorhabditis belari TaxID=2138241 RepID=A0AAF3EW92_9BILA
MNETLTLPESTPFYVKVYAYSIYAISIFVYFIVLSTLCIKYRIDNNVFAHSVYLFYIHTLFLLGEGLIVFSQPIALFPKLAFYLTGPLTRFRLSPHFWLIILFSLFQQLILSTGTCLMYRWLTFNHFRIRTYRVSSGLFHSSFIFHSIINLPFIFLFAISEVPKEAILDDGLAPRHENPSQESGFVDDFHVINKLIVPSLLGGSLLHSYSTLYTAWSGHVSLFTALNSLAKRKYTPQSQPDLSQKPTRNAREVEFAGIE